jgi:hypothetical protein
MLQLLAHTPWWLVVVILLTGAIALYYDNRKNTKHIGKIGLIVFTAGVLLGAAHFLIDTDPERMESNTRQIVADIDAQNWPGLQTMFDSQTNLDFSGLAPPGLSNVQGAEKIAQLMQAEAKQIGLKRAVLTGTRIEQNGDLIVVAFNIASWQQATGDPVVTSWQFNWRNRDGRWVVDSIKAIDLSGISAAPPAPTEETAQSAAAAPLKFVELLPTMQGDTSRRDPDGSIVLNGNQRLTTAQKYSPTVVFVIVAQTDSTNIRIAYAADQIIFNWEVDPDQMRIDGGPANGRHQRGAGRIPVNQWVRFRLRVDPKNMRIWVNGQLRFNTTADFSSINQPLSIFPQNGSTIKVKSVMVTTP